MSTLCRPDCFRLAIVSLPRLDNTAGPLASREINQTCALLPTTENLALLTNLSRCAPYAQIGLGLVQLSPGVFQDLSPLPQIIPLPGNRGVNPGKADEVTLALQYDGDFVVGSPGQVYRELLNPLQNCRFWPIWCPKRFTESELFNLDIGGVNFTVVSTLLLPTLPQQSPLNEYYCRFFPKDQSEVDAVMLLLRCLPLFPFLLDGVRNTTSGPRWSRTCSPSSTLDPKLVFPSFDENSTTLTGTVCLGLGTTKDFKERDCFNDAIFVRQSAPCSCEIAAPTAITKSVSGSTISPTVSTSPVPIPSPTQLPPVPITQAPIIHSRTVAT